MLDNSDLTEATNGSGLMRDGVYGRIRSDILTCVLTPGALLQEKDLAARYSMSKSPVRDALLRLQEQGLVEVMPRKGYRILPISLADARDLYDTRILLEKACIKRAVENATDEDLATLNRFRSAGENKGLSEWVNYNHDFHQAIAQLSGNARLTKMAKDIIDQFDRLTFTAVFTRPSEASSEKLVGEHCDIIDAIQTRNKTKAARLITAHVMKSRKRLFAVLENPPIVE